MALVLPVHIINPFTINEQSEIMNMIHLSLFDNTHCVICFKPVSNNALHCKGCLDAYLDSL